MGVMSRRVVPACGNLCFFCPSLRARSRQPVKRYKKMLSEILKVNFQLMYCHFTSVHNLLRLVIDICSCGNVHWVCDSLVIIKDCYVYDHSANVMPLNMILFYFSANVMPFYFNSRTVIYDNSNQIWFYLLVWKKVDLANLIVFSVGAMNIEYVVL